MCVLIYSGTVQNKFTIWVWLSDFCFFFTLFRAVNKNKYHQCCQRGWNPLHNVQQSFTFVWLLHSHISVWQSLAGRHFCRRLLSGYNWWSLIIEINLCDNEKRKKRSNVFGLIGTCHKKEEPSSECYFWLAATVWESVVKFCQVWLEHVAWYGWKAILTGGGGAGGLFLLFNVKLANSLVGLLFSARCLKDFFDCFDGFFLQDFEDFGGRGGGGSPEFSLLQNS